MTYPHDPRYAGDVLGLSIRRRFRRLPTDVQECLRRSGGLHHHRLDHVEAALAHVGVAGTLAWIGNGLPPCSRAKGARS